jgi:hypothetical protein
MVIEDGIQAPPAIFLRSSPRIVVWDCQNIYSLIEYEKAPW